MNNIEEYDYLIIPAKYYDTGNNFIYELAKLGKIIIDDCSIVCSIKIRNLIELWNTFLIAIEANRLSRTNDEDKLIKFIKNTNPSLYGQGNKGKSDIKLKIPINYICTYHKVLKFIAILKYKDISKYKEICNAKNKYLLKLITIFNSAIANYNLKEYKVSNFLINYINTEFKNIIINKSDIFVGYINDDYLYGIFTCDDENNPNFRINDNIELEISPIDNNNFRINKDNIEVKTNN